MPVKRVKEVMMADSSLLQKPLHFFIKSFTYLDPLSATPPCPETSFFTFSNKAFSPICNPI